MPGLPNPPLQADPRHQRSRPQRDTGAIIARPDRRALSLGRLSGPLLCGLKRCQLTATSTEFMATLFFGALGFFVHPGFFILAVVCLFIEGREA